MYVGVLVHGCGFVKLDISLNLPTLRGFHFNGVVISTKMCSTPI